MKQIVTVEERDGARYAAVTRSEACAKCRACEFGEKQTVLVPVGNEFAAGDRVVIELEEGEVATISLLLYGIPALGFVLGLVGASMATENELIMAGVAILACAAGLWIVRQIEKKSRRTGRHLPRVRRATPEEEET